MARLFCRTKGYPVGYVEYTKTSEEKQIGNNDVPCEAFPQQWIERFFMLQKNGGMEKASGARDMTEEQRHLWRNFLRSYPIRFQRKRTAEGQYNRFYCRRAGLIVEIDGAAGKFVSDGDVAVLRYGSDEVRRNFTGVCQQIERVAQERATASAHR